MIARSIAVSLSIVSLLLLVYINSQYTYANNLSTAPQLTASAIKAPRSTGKTFQFRGTANEVYKPSDGITIIKLHNVDKNIHIGVPVFSSMGTLEAVPRVGDQVRVIGNLGQYKGQPQLKPLAAEHVKIVAGPELENAVPLSEAVKKGEGNMLIGPVKSESVNAFTSNSGKKHYRVVLSDDKQIVKGIMFDGQWDRSDIKLLGSTRDLLIYAKVEIYKGQLSLQIHRVVPTRFE